MGCGSSVPNDGSLFSETVKKLENTMGMEGARNKTVDVRALVLLIWEARSHPELSSLVVSLLELNASDPNTFVGIEFYLPQLLHLIIHLDTSLSSAALEHFALFISQQSLHIALQVCWALIGLMEDYQAEDDEGALNPRGNFELYNRCATLMEKLELSVVFGSPRSDLFGKLLQNHEISSQELAELEAGDRKFQASFITSEVNNGNDSLAIKGKLLYKRWKERGVFHRDIWRERFFVVQYGVLYCYNVKSGAIKRAIPLHDFQVVDPPKKPGPGEKSEFYFELIELKRERKYMLRASSQQEKDRWITTLNRVISQPHVANGIVGALQTIDKTATEAAEKHNLTQTQVARYGFFRSERNFVRLLTDYCEELRFVDIPKRKEELRKRLRETVVPGCVYNPLCGSTDPWQRLLKPVPEQSFAFSTRARCPCLMTFEVAAEYLGAADEDVASYLFHTLGHNLDTEDHEALLSASFSLDSMRSLSGRKSFVRAARLSVTDMDPEFLKAVRDGVEDPASAGNGESKTSGGGRNAPDPSKKSGRLWTSSSEAEGETVERQKWKWDVLKSEVEKLAATAEPVNGSKDQRISPPPAPAAEPAKPKGRYLAALGKYHAGAALAVASKDPNAVVYSKLIAKSNDDLRQEVFIMQLINFLNDVWTDKGLLLTLRPYRIMSTAQTCGLIEVLTDSTSIDGLKKDNNLCKLGDYFRTKFTDPEELKRIQRNFTESFAGNSLMTYLLGIKDRHNGNLMLHLKSGTLTNIDFGFVLGMAPGKDKIKHTNFSMEKAAFKLTPELIDAMGGEKSDNYEHFKQLIVDGLLETRRHASTIITLVEIMGYKSKLPCFNQPGGGTERVIREMKKRLMLEIASEDQVKKKMLSLINHAAHSRGTRLYEKFQKFSNNIEPVL